MKVCEWCKQEFKPSKYTVNRQRFCDAACNAKWKYNNSTQPIVICQHCGKEYRPKAVDRTSYCSRECAYADRAARARGCATCGAVVPKGKKYCSEQCSLKILKCVQCNSEFVTGARTAYYCSDECRKEKGRQRWLEYATRKHNEVIKSRECKECGRVWTPGYGETRPTFCSDTCLHRNVKRVTKARRRARKYGNQYENVDPLKVLTRDNWKCQRCGVNTPKDKRGTTGDTAPEVDHIIPLALSGPHILSNLQCLCRRCNQEKGATIEARHIPIG